MQSTAPEIHAHELIDLIRRSNPALTPAELIEAAERQFGPAARFHTCSAAGLTVPQVIEFLLMRQKVV